VPLLEVDEVRAAYGRVEVLRGLSISVGEGQVVAVLGPNGVGKTTLMNTLAGLIRVSSGQIKLDGRRLDRLSPYEIARRGLLLVPEGRGIFPGLSVKDNLDIAVRADRRDDPAGRQARLDRVLERFPRLAERLSQQAGTLSGGEQQMLSMSRAFLGEPRVLMLDEISNGLAPIIVEELFEAVGALRAEGQTILMVEQYLTYALRHADYCYVLHRGQVAHEGTPAELEESGALESAYLTSA
jgi:branched-chain amino acid transport system ATP-binding protein